MGRKPKQHRQPYAKKRKAWKSNPEAVFLRTGKAGTEVEFNRAQRLAVRFLSREWRLQARKKGGIALSILPSFKERVHGGKLPEEDRYAISSQVDFVVNALCRHLDSKKRKRIVGKLKKKVSDEMLSINTIISPGFGNEPLKKLRQDSHELFNYIKKNGRIYHGFAFRGTARGVYFSRGWSKIRGAETTPAHEAVHMLYGLGLIKSDVPFAQAADRLYGLEHGIFKPSTRLKEPTFSEFDRQPSIDPETGLLNEPQWSYPLGNRIGQWVYLNLPREKRWVYLHERCMGLSHFDALKKLR